jgi:RecB family exonuclease
MGRLNNKMHGIEDRIGKLKDNTIEIIQYKYKIN